MVNAWHDIENKGKPEEGFKCVIEISKGSKTKYELDKETGMLMLDRVLYTSTHYPANYGFIPQTYADDNDPLDVLVLCQQTIIPSTIVEVKPIGVFEMIDDNEADEKIIAVPLGDPAFSHYNDLSELPPHIINEMKHFFEVYKELEHKETKVERHLGKDDAVKIIKQCLENYRKKFSK